MHCWIDVVAEEACPPGAHDGTWWPHLSEWLAARSDAPRRAPRAAGSRAQPPLADAPGTYVHSPG